MKIAGWTMTFVYMVILVVLVAVYVNTPFVTPANSGKVWSVWEMTKIAFYVVGVWLAGALVGSSAGKGE